MFNLDNGAEEAARHGIARSPKWHSVEEAHKKLEPVCQCCGDPLAPVQVHHIFPFHYCIALGRPDLELDHRNLISLCETEVGYQTQDHHLLVGHLANFKSSNLSADTDARTTFKGMTAEFLHNSSVWEKAKENRLKLLDEMTTAEKQDLRLEMDNRFPEITP